MDMQQEQILIKIKNLKKRFGDNIVLDGVDLEIPKSSVFSILGTSGTGKSVLIKCLIDILQADSGSIFYDGIDLLHTKPKTRYKKNKDFAYLFQESALFDSLSVKDNIAFPLRECLKIHDKHHISSRVKELLEWVNLPNTEKRMPSQLSGGMRKRVSFARTLAMQPKILLCDEPTTGLDPVTGKTIMNLIIKANKELGITCIVITHDVPESMRISDYLAFLDAGKIQAWGTKEEFINNPYTLLQQFIYNAFVEKDAMPNGNSESVFKDESI